MNTIETEVSPVSSAQVSTVEVRTVGAGACGDSLL